MGEIGYDAALQTDIHGYRGAAQARMRRRAGIGAGSRPIRPMLPASSRMRVL